MLPATDHSIRWSRYHDLPATEKTVIRLKALIGSSTTKTVFVTAMVATGTRAPDGKPWSAKVLNPVLDKLRVTELLDENLACDTGLLHPVAAEAAASPEGERLIQAVQSTFPAAGRRPYYSYTMQTDEDAL